MSRQVYMYLETGQRSPAPRRSRWAAWAVLLVFVALALFPMVSA
jgi:hypothetical protein